MGEAQKSVSAISKQKNDQKYQAAEKQYNFQIGNSGGRILYFIRARYVSVPHSFSDRSGVCSVPGVEYVFQDHRGTGYYSFVACGGNHPGLYGFWHVYVFCRYFYFAAFVRQLICILK